ncbi:DUF4937 domain-containing protein [Guptibacillus hwajinpoensis]|uniref:DUF4937 domain-containing protein n=1 Tax=Guptibacillus hwajinpoensis TaxID=208199 RepID=UPI001CFDD4D0|nr:DUF4937 domain-containing protein [Pseudalkalibacillus hwajinpoensis]WLR58681.1 DUF4937 domain-containing protein [Pseudalkalibacillus hwajinpoensis]
MLIKKIVCNVREGQEATFSRGQERWIELRNDEGFIAQYGGWSEGNVAIIIGFWKSTQSYNRFMNDDHDAIYLKTNQQGSIGSIDVQLEETDVRDIEQYSKSWMLEQHSKINEQWTIMT